MSFFWTLRSFFCGPSLKAEALSAGAPSAVGAHAAAVVAALRPLAGCRAAVWVELPFEGPQPTAGPEGGGEDQDED